MADIPLNSSLSQGLNDTENLLREHANSLKPSISRGNALTLSATELMHQLKAQTLKFP
jgi:hypothetical protein